MKKTFLLLCLPFLIFGCAPKVSKINIPEMNQSEFVVLKDLRPESESSDEIFSYLIASDAYGINRVNVRMVPIMTRLLQHRIYENFGNSNDPIEVTVHHMVVYLNMQAQMKKNILAGSIGGVVGMLATAGVSNNYVALHSTIVDPIYFESTAKNEYKRGLYTVEENPNKANVIITYIDAKINNKRVSIKTISPTDLPENLENQDPFINAVEAAIHYYLEQY